MKGSLTHAAMLVTLLLLSACSAQPTLTAGAPAAQPAVAPAKAAQSPSFSPKRDYSGQLRRSSDRVLMRLQLPPLPAYRTRALDLSTAVTLRASLTDSTGKRLEPVEAVDGKLAYPPDGQLSLSFSDVPAFELVIVELSVQDAGGDIPQASLAAVLASGGDDFGGSISFRTTPTALALKSLLSRNPDKARALDLEALQGFVDRITAAVGSGATTTYTTHPALVDARRLAMDLEFMSLEDLRPEYYRDYGATVYFSVNGLVGADRLRLQLTDAASPLVTSAGNGWFELRGVAPGAGLRLKAEPGENSGTSYSYHFSDEGGRALSFPMQVFEWGHLMIHLNATPATPVLTGISPAAAGAGASVTLSGSQFHRQPAGNTVTIGGQTATVQSVNAEGSEMTVTVPASLGPGSRAVQVSVGSASSASLNLSVLSGISALSAGSGKSYDQITLSGSGFSGATAVRFNGVAAHSFNVLGDTQITARVPFGDVSSGRITVVTPQGTATSNTDFSITSRSFLVRAAAAGANDSSSWLNAYADLQTALGQARAGDEVWVAGGKYLPASNGDRNASFVIPDQVAVYGGFAGNETSREARDPLAHATELSGDIDGSADVYDSNPGDGLSHGNIFANSFHVVRIGSGASLDGFSVRGANGDAEGGAILNRIDGSLGSGYTLRNLIVSGNTTSGAGGGLSDSQGSPLLERIVFSHNRAGSGGGLKADGATLSHAVIYANHAEAAGGFDQGGTSELSNALFAENVADTQAGGLRISGSARLSHVSFSRNHAPSGGGILSTGSGQFANLLCWDSPLANLTLPAGQGNVTAASDPFVTSADPPGGDQRWFTADDGLRLKPGAPGVVDQGVASLAGFDFPARDLLGTARPQGRRPDPGAYELPAMPPPAGSGLRISGEASNDKAGAAVSGAGDLNGDGYPDLVIGAPNAAPGGRLQAGKSYVIFGGANLGQGGPLSLASLNGSLGFKIHHVANFDFGGHAVAGAGDFNGDGYDDLILSAEQYDNDYKGASYLLYGSPSMGQTGVVELSALNGSTGLLLNGTQANGDAGDSLAGVGDLNRDGYADLLIGASGEKYSTREHAGVAYLVFGSASPGSVLNLDFESRGRYLRFAGAANLDRLGTAVAGAGDLNGDGHDDLVLGAPLTDKLEDLAGSGYAVFGSAGLSPGRTFDLYNMGSEAIELNENGAQSYYGRIGHSVAGAGDVNGDGFKDLLIGSPTYSYLVYGSASLSQVNPLKLMFPFYNPGAGVLFQNPQGSANAYLLSYTVKVSGGGDFNGDGYDDIILGANGECYVIFGSPSLGGTYSSFNPANLNGSNGFRLTGMAEYRSDYTKTVASAGDLNGDGFDDLIVGSPTDSAAYVVFGTHKPFPASFDIRNLTPPPAP